MQITVNADDFGKDENRTKAICAAFDRRLTSTTTAMANMPWFETAMTLAQERGFIDRVGLHFCVTEGEALSDEMKSCRVFCDENGIFTKAFHYRMKTRLVLPRAAKLAIAAEAKAQIERFLACGGKCLHLDSHHHSHTDLSVATTLLPIAKSYGFTSCRMSRTLSQHAPSLVKRLYKVAFNTYASRLLPFEVDEFTDFADFTHFYRRLQPSTRVEVMIHPIYRNSAGEVDLNGGWMDFKQPMSEIESFWREVKSHGDEIVGS